MAQSPSFDQRSVRRQTTHPLTRGSPKLWNARVKRSKQERNLEKLLSLATQNRSRSSCIRMCPINRGVRGLTRNFSKRYQFAPDGDPARHLHSQQRLKRLHLPAI